MPNRGYKHTEEAKRKIWNKGIKTGLVPRSAFKKGHVASWINSENYKDICKKISVAKTGKKNPKTAEKLKGRKASVETRQRQSEARKGKKWTENQRTAIIPKLLRGEAHPGWRGGITPINFEIRNSIQYRCWRADVFERDSFTCQECGERGGKLNADHINPFSGIIKKYDIKTFKEAKKCKELWDINNGRTLCVLCHRRTKTYGRGADKFLFIYTS
mgnify:CR=1 FL=1